ncbi:MAG: FHA domain-containing protein [Planctomycetota bacterium]|nr:FHA domain-containing protein [Planctomycetota bacterium]
MLILTAISGPHTGSVLELPEDKPAVLGRMCGSLPLHDSKASGYHADLWHENGHWYVSDHQSRNGTFVNREAITGKTRIENGSLVQVGRTAFAVTIMADDRQGAAARVTPAPGHHPARARTVDAADENEVAAEHASDAHGSKHGAAHVPAAVHVDLPANIAEDLAQHVVAALREAGNERAGIPHELLESIVARLDRQEQAQAQILAAATREQPRPIVPTDPEPLLRQLGVQIERQAQEQRDLLTQAAAAASAGSAPVLASLAADLDRRRDEQGRLIDAVRQAVDASAAQTKPALEQVLAHLVASQTQEQRLADGLREAIVQAVERATHDAASMAATQIETRTAEQFAEQNSSMAQTVAQRLSHQVERQFERHHEIQAQAMREVLVNTAAEQSRRDDRLIALVGLAATAGPESLRPALQPILAQLQQAAEQQERWGETLRQAIAAQTIVAQSASGPHATSSTDGAAATAAAAATSAEITRLAAGLAEHQARQEALAQQITQAIEAQGSRDEPLLQEIRRQLQHHTAAQADLAGIVREFAARPPAPVPATAEEIAAPLATQVSSQLSAHLSDKFAPALTTQLTSSLSLALAAPMIERGDAQAARLEQTLAALSQLVSARGAVAEPMLQTIVLRLEEQMTRQAELGAAVRRAAEAHEQTVPAALTVAQNAALSAQNASQSAAQLAADSIASQLRAHEAHRNELVAAVREASRGQSPRLEALLAQVLVQMQDQAVRHEQMASMFREATAGRPTGPDPTVLKQIADRLAAQDVRQESLLDGLRQAQARVQAVPADTAPVDAPVDVVRPLLERIVGALEQQHGRHDELARDVREAASRPASDPLLQHIVARLDAQDARQEELLGTMKQSLQAAPVRPVLENLVACMERQESLLAQWRAGVEQSFAAQAQEQAARAERSMADSQSLAAQSLATQFRADLASQIHAQEERHNQLVTAVREAVRAGAGQGDPALQQIASQLEAQAQRQEQMLAAMREVSAVREGAAVGDGSGGQVLRRIVDALAEQAAKQDELVATVRLAARAQGADLEPKLQEIRLQLDAQAARQEEHAAALQRAIESRPARQESLLAQLIVQLQEQALRHEHLANLWRDAARDRSETNEPALRQVAERLSAQAAGLEQALAGLRAAASVEPERVAPMLEQLAGELREQGQRHEQALADLRIVTDAQAQKAPALLAPLADRLREQSVLQQMMLDAITRPAEESAAEPAKAAELFGQIAGQVEAQTKRQDEFLATMREAQAAAAAGSEILLRQIAGEVEGQAQRHDQLLAAVRTLAQREAQAHQADQAATGEMSAGLAELTQKLQAQEEKHGQLLEAVRQAGKASAASPLFDQISARLETQAREHSELLSTLLSVRQAQIEGAGANRDAFAGASSAVLPGGPRLVLVPAPGAVGLNGEAASTEPILREIMAEYDARNQRYSELSAAIAPARPATPSRVNLGQLKIAASLALVATMGFGVAKIDWSSVSLLHRSTGGNTGERYASRSGSEIDTPSVPNGPAEQQAPRQQQQQQQKLPTTSVPPEAVASAHTGGISESDARAERAAGQNEAYRDILGRVLPTSGLAGRGGPTDPLAWNPASPDGSVAGTGASSRNLFSQFDKGDNLVESRAASAAGQPQGAPSAAPLGPYVTPVPNPDRGLTMRARAYKLAFETNTAITIGGRVDPATGRQSGGTVTLDPAAAKAAGVASWQDWYKLDDDAEQRRLQKQLKDFEAQKKGQAPFNLGDPIRTMPPASQPSE